MVVCHAALWNRSFLDLRYRGAGATVKHENLAALGGLDQRREHAAMAIRNVVKRRLRRYIVVPKIMMNGLETPAFAAARNVQRDDGR
ncbi:hypothetical protein D3C81_1320590 [compost metagenome]